MRNPVALVTGAAGGIGSAVVSRLSKAGYWVVGADKTVVSPGVDSVRFAAVDVGRAEEIRDLLRGVEDAEGRLDLLVHSAAVQICKPLRETAVEEWDQLMAVNLRAAYLLAREAYTLLRRGRGAIVNVSSVHAVATSANIAAYAASKGGLVALSRAMAVEMAPDGIRVNAVLPGAVDTSMLEAGLRRLGIEKDLSVLKAELAQRTLLGSIARPSEIAEAILFLGDGKRSSFITGQTLVVDGGATACLSTE